MSFTIIGIGELLWDMLPDGKMLGGAPANFAYWSTRLGNRGVVASRVGEDALGNDALALLTQADVETAYIQRDAERPTGTVDVELDASGQARYTIVEDVAWDFLAFSEQWADLATHADAICFGLLAQRAAITRATMRQFLAAAPADALRVLDVNFRPPYDDDGILRESLALADVVKLNDAELAAVATRFALIGDSEEEQARSLLNAYDLDLVCVTRGARGSLLVTATEQIAHPGFSVEVADTIGAGDSFTAALVHQYLRGAPLERIAAAANRLGTWVASQRGGMPPVDQQTLEGIRT
jgi:fructokinase